MRQQETIVSGYKIINIFPEKTTDEEWQEFAREILQIISDKSIN